MVPALDDLTMYPILSTGIFQAMVLFFLLAGDILVRYRIRRVVSNPAAGAA